MTLEPNFLIYGANGYTGQLITQLAIQQGMKPILAGRNENAIKKMAKKYKLPYEIVDLQNKEHLNDVILSVTAVLNCAGPVVHTFRPILEACLRNKTHYLDITGEINVFEQIAQMSQVIQQAEIMAMPGVGFDVVPSDCLAAYLKKQLPTATHLTLAFLGLGGISKGTANTMLENLKAKGAVRINGEIREVPHAYKTKQITFSKKRITTTTIPWGDVATAFYSTGIPNIEVYMAVSSGMLSFLRMNNGKMGWWFRRNFVKNFLQKMVNLTMDGPTVSQRKKGKSFLWGEVTDKKGSKVVARLTTPEGYTLTAMTALAAVAKVLCKDAPIGFQTPSMAYGADFIMEIPGVVREDVIINRKINID